MQFAFEKWHGCKNDFIVTWITDSDGDVVDDSLKRQAAALCDRRTGIGGDGLLVLRTKKQGDLLPDRLTIINSDGSVAKTCGNGLRCAALSVLKAHRERGNPKDLPELVELTVEGVARVCRYVKHESKGSAFPLVAVEMGVPTLGVDVSWYKSACKAAEAAARTANAPELSRDVGVCEIGNPHIVFSTDQQGDSLLSLLRTIGPALQGKGAPSPLDGVNVHITSPAPITAADQARAGNELGHRLGEIFKVLVWERGAGETMACGSGACAVAALALATGLIEREAWIAVDMPGGRLYVKHPAAQEPVLLAGPGVYVFSGAFAL